jgi:hypothetical protein
VDKSSYLSIRNRVAAWFIYADGKKFRVYDFDETLAVAHGSVSVTHSDGETTTMDSATFAYFSPTDGDQLDFGAFNDVNNPRKIKANWESFVEDTKREDTTVYILTARPKGSETSVKSFLESEGVMGVGIVALASSDPYDKAKWMDRKMEEEGYTDVRFVDDSTRNVSAVREYGEKFSSKGVSFESVHSPHPKDDSEFLGPPVKKQFKSTNPTVALVEIKSKGGGPPKSKEEKGEGGASSWWDGQTQEFQTQYCKDHGRSKYCGSVTASDATVKKGIRDRARKSGNQKVKKYAEEFVKKMDQAGQAAGIFMEEVESGFDRMAKKKDGLLKGFSTKDFNVLHEVLFEIERGK